MLPLRSERRLSGQCENQRAAALEADAQHFARSCRAAALEIVVRAWWHGPSGGACKEAPDAEEGALPAPTNAASSRRASDSSASASATKAAASPRPPSAAAAPTPPSSECRPRFGRRPRSASATATAPPTPSSSALPSPMPTPAHSAREGAVAVTSSLEDAVAAVPVPSQPSRPPTAAARRRPGTAALARTCPRLRREDWWIRSFARTQAVTKSLQQEVLLMESLFLHGVPRKLASVAASFGATLAVDARCASFWPTLKSQESAERVRVAGGFYESEQEQSTRLAAKASLFLDQVVSNIFDRFFVHCVLGQNPPLVLAPRTRFCEPLGPAPRGSEGDASPAAHSKNVTYSDEVLQESQQPSFAETMCPEATTMTALESSPCTSERSRKKKRGLKDRISDRAEQMFDQWLQSMKDSDDILAKAIASEPCSPEGPLSPASMGTAATAMTTLSTRPVEVSPRRSITTARSSMMAARTTSGVRRGSSQRRASCGRRISRTRESAHTMPTSLNAGRNSVFLGKAGPSRSSPPRRGSTGYINHGATAFL